MATQCTLCRVEGRVQGVWFRASTQEQAERLGLTGYAHNLPDGAVEVLACGAPAALDQLRAWLQRGPTMAQVSRLQCRDDERPAPVDFTTG